MTTTDDARSLAQSIAAHWLPTARTTGEYDAWRTTLDTLRSLADQLDAAKDEDAQRAGIAESEAVAAQRRRAEKAERELAEIKAQAAVLRDALGGINAYLPCRPCPESPDCEVGLAQTCKRRAAALATDAGKAQLAAVNAALEQYFSFSQLQTPQMDGPMRVLATAFGRKP